MARPERFELPTTWFEARYSIQLSYGRLVSYSNLIAVLPLVDMSPESDPAYIADGRINSPAFSPDPPAVAAIFQAVFPASATPPQ
jgi:hypothetical protein